MKRPRLRWYPKMWLLFCALGCSACASVPTNLPPSHIPTGPRDVDVDQGRLESVDRYHRPRIEHRYTYDQTDVDIATPIVSSPPDTSSQPAP